MRWQIRSFYFTAQITSHKTLLAEISNINIFHITQYFWAKSYKRTQWNLPNILAYFGYIRRLFQSWVSPFNSCLPHIYPIVYLHLPLFTPCLPPIYPCITPVRYLVRRQQQWREEERRRRESAPDPACPPGHSRMPDQERLQTLHVLRDSEWWGRERGREGLPCQESVICVRCVKCVIYV